MEKSPVNVLANSTKTEASRCSSTGHPTTHRRTVSPRVWSASASVLHCTRDDVVMRYGGEELASALPGAESVRATVAVVSARCLAAAASDSIRSW